MGLDPAHRVVAVVGVRPDALEHVVGILGRPVARDEALLVHVREVVLRAERRAEVLERPLRVAGKAGQRLRDAERPVEQVHDVALRPVAVVGDARDLDLADGLAPLIGVHEALAVDGRLGVTADVAGASVFHVEQAWVPRLRVEQRVLVLGVDAGVPPRPDGRREHVDDVGAVVVLPDGRQAGRVELVGDVVETLERGVEPIGIVAAGNVGEPVDLVAERPQDHARVVAVLGDLLAEEPLRVGHPGRPAHAAAVPREFVPDQEPEAVGGLVDDRVLRVVTEADEVGAHPLDLLHVAAVDRVGDGRGEAGVVLVPVRAAEQQPLAVEEEGAAGLEREPAEAERLRDGVGHGAVGQQLDLDAVEVGGARGPQVRVGDRVEPHGDGVARASEDLRLGGLDDRAGRVHEAGPERVPLPHSVPAEGDADLRHAPRSADLRRQDVRPFDVRRRYVLQPHVAGEAPEQEVVGLLGRDEVAVVGVRDADEDLVLAVAELIRHVHLEPDVAADVPAGPLAVDVHVGRHGRALEIQEVPAAGLWRQDQRLAVPAGVAPVAGLQVGGVPDVPAVRERDRLPPVGGPGREGPRRGPLEVAPVGVEVRHDPPLRRGGRGGGERQSEEQGANGHHGVAGGHRVPSAGRPSSSRSRRRRAST